MKVIISHDIDYISFFEHNRNLVIPKFAVRNLIERVYGYISWVEIKRRCRSLIRNKYQNTNEQMTFDKENGVRSTFFVAVNRGRDNLSYPLAVAKYWIHIILERRFDVGVHCIAFEEFEKIKEEYERFRTVAGFNCFGCRIHYVKANEKTYDYLEKTGYTYDSTVFGKMENPYRIGRMWEFPLHIMDSFIMNCNGKWQTRNLEQAIEVTKRKIDAAYEMGLRYFNCLSHDIYFSDAYLTWRNWYIWMISYFKENGFRFVSYKQAIEELEENSFSASR